MAAGSTTHQRVEKTKRKRIRFLRNSLSSESSYVFYSSIAGCVDNASINIIIGYESLMNFKFFIVVRRRVRCVLLCCGCTISYWLAFCDRLEKIEEKKNTERCAFEYNLVLIIHDFVGFVQVVQCLFGAFCFSVGNRLERQRLERAHAPISHNG